MGPRACYDEGKRVAETMVYAYAKQVYTKSLLVLNMQVTVEVLCSSYLTGGGSVADKNIYTTVHLIVPA